MRGMILGLALTIGWAGGAHAQTAGNDPGACAKLADLPASLFGDPTATISSARFVEAGPGPAEPYATMPPAPLPRHCELFGTLEQRTGANGQPYAIRFHMRLPVTWNGRFLFQGGGGINGLVGSAVGVLMGALPQTAINLGYTVVSQDSGHDLAVNADPKLQGPATFGWDAQARRNYGFASIGTVTKAAKTIINAYYGRMPRYSYFVGGSKGGQEGFMAAQRFGREFDGVLSGYPGFRLATAATAGEMWDNQAFAGVARAIGADGLPLLNKAFTDDDLALVSKAVLESCDDIDGLKDGMVFALGQCSTSRVRPALTRITCTTDKRPDCLLPVQIDALIRVQDGARDASGKPVYASWPWDAGIGGKAATGYFTGWRLWKLGQYAAPVNNGLNLILAPGSVSAVLTSPPTPVAADPTAMTRYALGIDVMKAEAATHVKWGAFDEAAVDFMNAQSLNLRTFTAHGGKLLVYHGASDPVFSINDTIAWLTAVDAHERGKAARFVRLFAVPGFSHGAGGPATDQADFFSALVAWTEQGVAPRTIVATAQAETAWPGRTRLLCPYPSFAHYAGGDPERAGSFTCR